MRRFIAVIFNILTFSFALYSQNNLNTSAESIIGEYEVRHQGELSYVKVTEDTDGTFRAQVFWVEDRLDDDGNVRLDSKNPDKSLRHVVCDEIVLFSGLKYDSEHMEWSGVKIYDPTRGIRVNVTCRFESDGRLRVKGSLFGISQSIYWHRLK